MCTKNYHNIDFQENRFVKKWSKSPEIVFITLTPGQNESENFCSCVMSTDSNLPLKRTKPTAANARIRVARFFLVQTYQNGKIYQMTKILNGNKLYQMIEKYSKWSWNITTFSFPRPSKFYPNCDFWFENKPSGNPGKDGWLRWWHRALDRWGFEIGSNETTPKQLKTFLSDFYYLLFHSKCFKIPWNVWRCRRNKVCSKKPWSNKTHCGAVRTKIASLIEECSNHRKSRFRLSTE
jgi:hypothetical protein